MPVKSRLTEKDFINASFIVLYSRRVSIFFTVFLFLCLLASICLVLFSDKGSYFLVLLSLVMNLLVPVKTYYSSKQNFISNKRISETMEYQFEKDFLVMKGESFTSQSSWDKIYKLTQTKNWIFIWQNRQIAHPLPKRDIQDGQFKELKEILQTHHITNNL